MQWPALRSKFQEALHRVVCNIKSRNLIRNFDTGLELPFIFCSSSTIFVRTLAMNHVRLIVPVSDWPVLLRVTRPMVLYGETLECFYYHRDRCRSRKWFYFSWNSLRKFKKVTRNGPYYTVKRTILRWYYTVKRTILHGWNLFRSGVAHKFQLKVA